MKLYGLKKEVLENFTQTSVVDLELDGVASAEDWLACGFKLKSLEEVIIDAGVIIIDDGLLSVNGNWSVITEETRILIEDLLNNKK